MYICKQKYHRKIFLNSVKLTLSSNNKTGVPYFFFLRNLELKSFLETFKQISRIWKTNLSLLVHVIVLKMLKNVAIISSKYIFLHQNLFFFPIKRWLRKITYWTDDNHLKTKKTSSMCSLQNYLRHSRGRSRKQDRTDVSPFVLNKTCNVSAF